MAKTYWEKLKDPRWQRKRLEAMERSGFACEVCYDDEQTLHVHHKQYFKGRDPWEYDDKQLAVLCESCHGMQHESEDALSLVCSYLDLDGPWSRDTLAAVVSGYVGKPMPKDADKFAFDAGVFGATVLARYTDIAASKLIVEVCAKHSSEAFDLLHKFAKERS